MPEHKPRMTFWGERIETIPQGFKENLKKKAEDEKTPEPPKRKYTRHTESEEDG